MIIKHCSAGNETIVRSEQILKDNASISDKEVVSLTYFDAFTGTPILDIKPYQPSIDKVESPEVPEWCAHWPKNFETSGEFDWGKEFNF